jgi:hypothetical protein
MPIYGSIWAQCVAAVPCEEGDGCGGPLHSAAAARAPCVFSSSKIGFTLQTMMRRRGCVLPLSVGPCWHRWHSSWCPYRFPHGSPPCWTCQLNHRALRAVNRATSACSHIAAFTQSLLQRCLLTCLHPTAHGFACVLSLFVRVPFPCRSVGSAICLPNAAMVALTIGVSSVGENPAAKRLRYTASGSLLVAMVRGSP